MTARTSPGTSWRSHGIAQQDIDTVWTAIALHTAPGIPEHVQPVVALVTAGVGMDVLGLAYSEYSDAERKTVVHANPRSAHFKEEIIQAFHQAQDRDDLRQLQAKTVADQFAETLAAAGVKRGDILEREQVAEAIAGLVMKSLVAVETSRTGTLYRLLDTTRAYILAK